ncbi:MAG TPA: FlgD immunoglobulin-like domain containing protein [Candidatus Krumholzibacteria bacterium]|nr:FlgD immunoglobulin-like domain containing protein [Candidatus Krumholzibacteria bacterium]
MTQRNIPRIVARHVAVFCALVTVLACVTSAARAQIASDTPRWLIRGGGIVDDSGYSTAVDASGNVFVAGRINAKYGGVDFDGTVVSGPVGYDGFVMSIDPRGALRRVRTIGGEFSDWATGVALDADGNVIVVGEFRGEVDLGGGPVRSTGSADIFVIKYDEDGIVRWARSFGGSREDNVFGVAVGPDGSIHLAGDFRGTIDFGGGPASTSNPTGNEPDGFDLKLDADGNYVWSHTWGSNWNDWARAIAVDATGAVMVGGFETLYPSATQTAPLRRYSADGSLEWRRQLSGGGEIFGVGVAASGQIFATGKRGAPEGFVTASFGTDGTEHYADYHAGTVDGTGIAVGPSDFMIVGSFKGTVDFGGQERSTIRTLFYVAHYNFDGSLRSVLTYGQPYNSSSATAVALIPPAQGYVVTGTVGSQLDIGTGIVTSAGSTDIFVARYGAAPPLLGDAPAIRSIVDVGNDQGGRVNVSFERSGQDAAGAPLPVLRYDVRVREEPPAVPPVWQTVASVPAHGQGTYRLLVPTFADRTPANPDQFSALVVRAITGNPATFFDSAIDSGYSLDNLAPSPPANLALAGTLLAWDAPSGAAMFRVYGSPADDLAAAVVLASTRRTSLNITDTPHAYYFVTALDDAENESAPTRVAGPGEAMPAAVGLSLIAVPNPFNPQTSIRYKVPSPGRVVLRIYDTRGALVTTLVDGDQVAGEHSLGWRGTDARDVPVGSGIYFARLQTPAGSRVQKLILLR